MPVYVEGAHYTHELIAFYVIFGVIFLVALYAIYRIVKKNKEQK